MQVGIVVDVHAPVVVHLEHLRERHLRPNTITARYNLLRRLALHAGCDVMLVDEAQIVAFLGRVTRSGRPQAAESRATELSHVRGFFRWAAREGLIDHDPTLRLDRPRLPRRLPRPMPDAQVEDAIAHAPARRVRPALLFAAFAGLRAQDMHCLATTDLWWSNRPPLILIPDQKGGGQATVPMSVALRQMLDGCELPAAGWIFPRLDGGRGPLPPWMVSRTANDYLHDRGITHTLHTLRHWFGTQAYRLSGGDLRHTQELMRHSSVASTQLYTQIVPQESADILDRMPAIGQTRASGDDAA